MSITSQDLPTFEDFLDKVVFVDNTIDDCPCCRCRFDGVETIPVRLPCQGGHVYCQACLNEWFNGGAEHETLRHTNTCPTCREKLFRTFFDLRGWQLWNFENESGDERDDYDEEEEEEEESPEALREVLRQNPSFVLYEADAVTGALTKYTAAEYVELQERRDALAELPQL